MKYQIQMFYFSNCCNEFIFDSIEEFPVYILIHEWFVVNWQYVQWMTSLWPNKMFMTKITSIVIVNLAVFHRRRIRRWFHRWYRNQDFQQNWYNRHFTQIFHCLNANVDLDAQKRFKLRVELWLSTLKMVRCDVNEFAVLRSSGETKFSVSFVYSVAVLTRLYSKIQFKNRIPCCFVLFRWFLLLTYLQSANRMNIEQSADKQVFESKFERNLLRENQNQIKI